MDITIILTLYNLHNEIMFPKTKQKYQSRHVVFEILLHRSIKQCSVRVYRQLFVGGLMSYLHYLCLFAHSGVQHILCCVFILFVFVLCTLCYQFLYIVHFWFPLRYSLTFIEHNITCNVMLPRCISFPIHNLASEIKCYALINVNKCNRCQEVGLKE